MYIAYDAYVLKNISKLVINYYANDANDDVIQFAMAGSNFVSDKTVGYIFEISATSNNGTRILFYKMEKNKNTLLWTLK